MIKIEVPNDPNVLKEVGKMFLALSGATVTEPLAVEDTMIITKTESDGQGEPIDNTAGPKPELVTLTEEQIESGVCITGSAGSGGSGGSTADQDGPVELGDGPGIYPDRTNPPDVTFPDSVELDGEGIPWDARIHSGGKTKYAKAPFGWKKKRGVPGYVVTTVEQELRNAMAASPDNPVIPEPEPEASEAFAPPPPDEAPPVDAPSAAAVTSDGPITSFAELNLAITAKGIDAAAVQAAVNKAGLQAYPLLAARADLVPVVAKELGL